MADHNTLPSGLQDILAQHPVLAILTGAGVSAESGIPTFREAQTGLWARFSPQELATPEAFARDPEQVWAWYQWRRELVQRGAPNAAHEAIASIQAHSGPEHCLIITQNVDGLHQRGGATDVTELHGNLWRERCSKACRFFQTVDTPGPKTPPRCPQCDAMLRPDVVWFGESLMESALERAEAAVQTADVVIVSGTSNQVYPAASFPLEALRLGKTVVEINPVATPLSARAHYFLKANASAVFPAISKRVCR